MWLTQAQYLESNRPFLDNVRHISKLSPPCQCYPSSPYSFARPFECHFSGCLPDLALVRCVVGCCAQAALPAVQLQPLVWLLIWPWWQCFGQYNNTLPIRDTVSDEHRAQMKVTTSPKFLKIKKRSTVGWPLPLCQLPCREKWVLP